MICETNSGSVCRVLNFRYGVMEYIQATVLVSYCPRSGKVELMPEFTHSFFDPWGSTEDAVGGPGEECWGASPSCNLGVARALRAPAQGVVGMWVRHRSLRGLR